MSMVGDSYGTGDVLPGRAIYPSSRLALYIGLLSAAKFFRAIGLFISYDLLKLVPVVQFLFILKAGSTLPLVFLQKPFSSGRRLTKAQWFRIARHAFFGSAISFLWLFGLTQCGPLRTILLFEHADCIIIAAATALFTSSGGGPSKLRGAVFFLVAVVTLLLFDHDEKLDHMSEHESDHIHGSVFHHLFNHIVTLTGMSDHKGGVVLLFVALCLQVGYNSAAKKLSVEVGGGKRLHALSTTVASLLLLPWAAFSYLTRESDVESWLYLLFPLMLVVLFMGVVDFYLEAVAVNHLQPAKTAMYGTLAMFLSALALSYTWNHPYIAQATTLHKLSEVITEDHVLSGGVIFSLMVFLLATRLLSSPGRMSKGSFIGYSAAGLPLYSFTGDMLAKTSQSLLSHLKSGLKEILSESDSRRIFYFLCVNLSFTFVELVYGVWTNSLGLISDGFHMLFDCSALVMGLYAAIMSRWKPTRIFSFGYDRVEVLSGFINGLFLVVIAIFVFAAAVARLFEPPEIKTERLLTVSILGLLVNLVGIFAFHGAHHGHSHGGGGSRQQECSHSHSSHSHTSHGHSHGHSGHGHSHASHGHSHHSAPSHHGHSHNANMEGVFLHILADTMGSVGVIISTLLIESFGWNIADPICSLFIASLIFLSVIPLFKETAVILLLRTPTDITAEISEALQKVLLLEGVLAYRDPHFWSHTPTKTFGTLHLQVAPDANEQKIITQVSLVFKDVGLQSMTLQVEKEAYFQHLTGLGAAFDQMVQHTQNFQALNFDPTDVKAV